MDIKIQEKVLNVIPHCLRADNCSHCEGCPYNVDQEFTCRAKLRDDIKKLLKAHDEDEEEVSKTNILTLHCNHPVDVYYWLAGKVKFRGECSGGRYPYTDENWEELKDGNQVVSISWDQSFDEYLVVFRVEEEE